MLINIDIKGVEWVCIVYLSQDKVGMQEILAGVDQHGENQKTFGLPDRRIAKIFVFRLIYGGSAWSYCFDPDFNWISKSPVYWQNVIDRFYDKYKGINQQHDLWVQTAIGTGQLVMPTGRTYIFEPIKLSEGGFKWPRTKILNYPVQGLAADIASIVRVSLRKRIRKIINDCIIKFVSTVHDSIILDCNCGKDKLDSIKSVVDDVFRDIPDNFYKLFNIRFNLPLSCEIKYGNNLLDMQPI